MSKPQQEFRVARVTFCHPDGRIEAVLPPPETGRRKPKPEQSFILDQSACEAGQVPPQIGDQIIIKITASNPGLQSGLSARRAKKPSAKNPVHNPSKNADITPPTERMAQLIRILPKPENHLLAVFEKWPEGGRKAKFLPEFASDRPKNRAKTRAEKAKSRQKLEKLPKNMGIAQNDAIIGEIRSIYGKEKSIWWVRESGRGGAMDGEIVFAELKSESHSDKFAVITERLGQINTPNMISRMMARAQNLPMEFSPAVLAEAEKLSAPINLPNRDGMTPLHLDWRDKNFVTIDGSDAQDFDDAVCAEAIQDSENYRLWVAIADVAYFVSPGSELDRAARERGNSVYFPDWVIPMLPEKLSNHLCSLRPDQDRACLVAEMVINPMGDTISSTFMRVMIRSKARLTYEQVEAQIFAPNRENKTIQSQNNPPATSEISQITPQIDQALRHLRTVYLRLLKQRDRRQTLDLAIPQPYITIDETSGAVTHIRPRAILSSHKLIEEMMIAANVAAARLLHEASHHLHHKTQLAAHMTLYRRHDPPPSEKHAALLLSLKNFRYEVTGGAVPSNGFYRQALIQAEKRGQSALMSRLILAAQAQAIYHPTPQNEQAIGHFGLGLEFYCHFTSPIRRYADLVVHRAIIAVLGLAGDQAEKNHATHQAAHPPTLPTNATESLSELGAHVSRCERRAMEAERGANDRYVAAFFAGKKMAKLTATISSVTKFGFFVTLVDYASDGLVPMRGLPQDYYHFDPVKSCLIGERRHRVFRLGDAVEVMLAECDIITGQMSFRLA